MISVGLADDHVATRHGIKTIIEMNSRIKVVLEAGNGNELLEKLATEELIPDILLLDINMPVLSGTEVIIPLREKWPKMKVLVYSFFSEIDRVINMIHRGAAGYINKSSDPTLLANAIITTHTQGIYLNDLVKKEYFDKVKRQVLNSGFYGQVTLTPKEVAFIRLSASELTYKTIADKMGVSPKTVENYRESLFKKLDVKNRVAIVLYGIRNGLIDLA